LLVQAGVGLQLASGGEDVGRLVRAPGDDRTDLVNRTLATPDLNGRRAVEHAVALFRGRTSNREEKRGALVALARVPEDRRQSLEDELMKKDEGTFFRIAN
jgi:hypothetical protein